MSIDYEQAFLACILSGEKIPPEATPEMFFRKNHRVIFEAVREVSKYTTPDKDNVNKYIDQSGKRNEVGIRYIGMLLNKNIQNKEFQLGKINYYTSELIRISKNTVWTGEQLLTCEFPPIQWLVPELITTGLSLLAGAPKLGKSWLMLSVAIAVASGEHVLGKIPVDKADVLYLALEDTGRRLQDRLRKLNAKSLDNLHFFTEWNSGLIELSDYVQEHKEIRLIIIDTWGRFTKVDNQNDYSETTQKAIEIKAIADKLDVAIVIVHHTRKKTKDSSKDWLDDVLGSQGLSGAADSTIILRRGRGDKKADLLITGRDIPEKELVLSFDLNCGGWSLEGDKNDIQESDARQSIFEWIKDNGPHTPKDIFEGMKEEGETRASSSVRRLLSGMANAGVLQNNNGVYALADRSVRPAQEAGSLKDTPEQHEQTSAS